MKSTNPLTTSIMLSFRCPNEFDRIINKIDSVITRLIILLNSWGQLNFNNATFRRPKESSFEAPVRWANEFF